MKRLAGLTILFVAGTLVMTRPTLNVLRTSLPANLGDPALITWTLHWGAHSLTTAPMHYFDANIYWHHPSALAYADLLTPLVPVYGTVYALTHSWTAATDVTVLLALVGSLAATFALLRWITGRDSGAVVGAFAFTFSGFVLADWGHIQLDSLGLLSLAALLTGLVIERRRLVDAALLGVANAAVVYGAVYYGVIWSVSMAVMFAVYLVVRRGRPGPGLARCLVVTGAVSLVVVAPAAYQYVHLQHTENHTRALEPDLGLKPRDLLSPANGSYLWSRLDPASGVEAREHGYFPGFSVAVLAALGAGFALRRRQVPPASALNGGPVDPRARTTMVLLLVVAGVVALVLAAGPTVRGHAAPERFFHDHVPGFAGIRVTGRFSIIAFLAGATLAAVGWQAIADRLRSRWVVVATAAALATVCLDLAAPVTWWKLPADRETLAVYRALSGRPVGAVVELPMADPRGATSGYPYVESPRMVYSTLDWHPRVNGYSGFVPHTYFNDIDAFAALPAASGFDHAVALGVRYLVLHVGNEHGYAAFSEEAALRIVAAAPAGSHSRRYGASWLIDLGG